MVDRRAMPNDACIWSLRSESWVRATMARRLLTRLEDALEDRGRASLFSSLQLGRTEQTAWTRWKQSAGQGH
jgi:hypothetical protein